MDKSTEKIRFCCKYIPNLVAKWLFLAAYALGQNSKTANKTNAYHGEIGGQAAPNCGTDKVRANIDKGAGSRGWPGLEWL